LRRRWEVRHTAPEPVLHCGSLDCQTRETSTRNLYIVAGLPASTEDNIEELTCLARYISYLMTLSQRSDPPRPDLSAEDSGLAPPDPAPEFRRTNPPACPTGGRGTGATRQPGLAGRLDYPAAGLSRCAGIFEERQDAVLLSPGPGLEASISISVPRWKDRGDLRS
jgi:hypothetical protein